MASSGPGSHAFRIASKPRIITRSYSNVSSTLNNDKTVRILMLHGFTQSGTRFESKTQNLREGLRRAIPSTKFDFVFPTAPSPLNRDALPPFDMDGASKQDERLDAYTWWHIVGRKPPYHYDGLEAAMSHLAGVIRREGPFDGAMGFSQGAAATAMVASLLEQGRKRAFDRAEAGNGISYPSSFIYQGEAIQQPLKFAIALSGFGNTHNPLYTGFYNPQIVTPFLHVLGEADNFILPGMSQELIDVCTNAQVARHPGGHVVPRDLDTANNLAAWLKQIL